jgi:hypothetical protein
MSSFPDARLKYCTLSDSMSHRNSFGSGKKFDYGKVKTYYTRLIPFSGHCLTNYTTLHTLFLNKTQRMKRRREDEDKKLVTEFVNTEQKIYIV